MCALEQLCHDLQTQKIYIMLFCDDAQALKVLWFCQGIVH